MVSVAKTLWNYHERIRDGIITDMNEILLIIHPENYEDDTDLLIQRSRDLLDAAIGNDAAMGDDSKSIVCADDLIRKWKGQVMFSQKFMTDFLVIQLLQQIIPFILMLLTLVFNKLLP